MVKLLIRHGAEIDKQDGIGGTALMGATYYGHERVVDLLLRHGAEINLRDSLGCTALMLAADKRRRQTPRAGGRVAAAARR